MSLIFNYNNNSQLFLNFKINASSKIKRLKKLFYTSNNIGYLHMVKMFVMNYNN